MFNERMGNETGEGFENQDKEVGKKSLKKFNRDCEAKQEILMPLLSYPDGLTLNELYRLSDYKGSKGTFKSNLTKYATGAVTVDGRRIIKPELQYVNRIGKRGSYTYILNSNGVQKAINDPLFYRRKQMEEHKEWREQFAEHHFVNTEGGGSAGGVQYIDRTVSRNFGDELDRHTVDKSDDAANKLNVDELKYAEIAELKNKNKKLVDANRKWKEIAGNMKAIISELEFEKESKNTISEMKKANKSDAEIHRVIGRMNLVAEYELLDRLDIRFFDIWGFHPTRVKGSRMIGKGDVEILNTHDMNDELRRKHAKHVLSSDDILKGGFRITRKTKNGIYVIDELGGSMEKERYMSY